MDNATISNIAFVIGLGVVALAIFGKVNIKHGLLIGGGFAVVGYATRPTDVLA